MPNQFTVIPGGNFSQGLAGLSGAINRVGIVKREEEKEQRKLEASQQAGMDLMDAWESQDYGGISKIFASNPKLQSSLKSQLGILEAGNRLETDRRTKSEVDFMREVLTAAPEQVEGLYKRHIRELRIQGSPTVGKMEKSLQDYLKDPQKGTDNSELKQMALAFSALASPAEVKAFEKQIAEGGPKISPPSFKDTTAASLAEYERTGDSGVLVRYEGIKEIMGIKHHKNPTTQMWEPIVDLRSTDLSDQKQAETKLEAEKQSKLDFTKAQSKFQESESKLVSAIGSGESKDVILQDTAAEMRRLASGWSTQYGATLSSLPASEARKMKGLINTIRANSAFTTLVDLKSSGGTLGAISESELILLESAMGSLDQAGTIVELNRVLGQILTANTSSLQRIKNAYSMDKKKYGSSFEEATKLSDDDLVSKYLKQGG